MHLSGAVAHLNVCVNVCISSEKRNKERGKQNQQQQLMDGWIAEAACFDHQHVRLLAAFHPSDPSRCTRPTLSSSRLSKVIHENTSLGRRETSPEMDLCHIRSLKDGRNVMVATDLTVVGPTVAPHPPFFIAISI